MFGGSAPARGKQTSIQEIPALNKLSTISFSKTLTLANVIEGGPSSLPPVPAFLPLSFLPAPRRSPTPPDLARQYFPALGVRFPPGPVVYTPPGPYLPPPGAHLPPPPPPPGLFAIPWLGALSPRPLSSLSTSSRCRHGSRQFRSRQSSSPPSSSRQSSSSSSSSRQFSSPAGPGPIGSSVD